MQTQCLCWASNETEKDEVRVSNRQFNLNNLSETAAEFCYRNFSSYFYIHKHLHYRVWHICVGLTDI